MVKANAYGLGAVPVARALAQVDPWGYGVATVEEGEELRQAGITRPILVFTPLQSGQTQAFLASALRPVIADLPALREWTSATELPFHLEIDTGMSRSGLRWQETELLTAANAALTSAKGWEGIFTHFHTADDRAATAEQWRRFEQVVSGLPRRPALIHASNSGSALRDRAYSSDLVRPGIFLYGGEAGGAVPQVVARVRARVIALRTVQPGDTVSYGATWAASAPTRIATVSLGYADGVPRSLGNRGQFEIRGRLAPLVGRVAMDMVMVAVDETVAQGDVATFFGGLVSLDAQAQLAGTVSYELLTSIGPRVVRRYGSAP
jgi:alanine racemase